MMHVSGFAVAGWLCGFKSLWGRHTMMTRPAHTQCLSLFEERLIIHGRFHIVACVCNVKPLSGTQRHAGSGKHY